MCYPPPFPPAPVLMVGKPKLPLLIDQNHTRQSDAGVSAVGKKRAVKRLRIGFAATHGDPSTQTNRLQWRQRQRLQKDLSLEHPQVLLAEWTQRGIRQM